MRYPTYRNEIAMRSLATMLCLLCATSVAAVGAATEASLSLATHNAEVKAYLNSEALAIEDGAAELVLQDGINVLALEASAAGERPCASTYTPRQRSRPSSTAWSWRRRPR